MAMNRAPPNTAAPKPNRRKSRQNGTHPSANGVAAVVSCGRKKPRAVRAPPSTTARTAAASGTRREAVDRVCALSSAPGDAPVPMLLAPDAGPYADPRILSLATAGSPSPSKERPAMSEPTQPTPPITKPSPTSPSSPSSPEPAKRSGVGLGALIGVGVAVVVLSFLAAFLGSSLARSQEAAPAPT